MDFAELQAEREQAMTMKDWANHLDRILTMSGENLLQNAGSVSHDQATEKATQEYKKFQEITLSESEKKLYGKPKKYRTTSKEKTIKKPQKYNLSQEEISFIESMIKPMG